MTIDWPFSNQGFRHCEGGCHCPLPGWFTAKYNTTRSSDLYYSDNIIERKNFKILNLLVAFMYAVRLEHTKFHMTKITWRTFIDLPWRCSTRWPRCATTRTSSTPPSPLPAPCSGLSSSHCVALWFPLMLLKALSNSYMLFHKRTVLGTISLAEMLSERWAVDLKEKEKVLTIKRQRAHWKEKTKTKTKCWWLKAREEIARQLTADLERATDKWGIHVLRWTNFYPRAQVEMNYSSFICIAPGWKSRMCAWLEKCNEWWPPRLRLREMQEPRWREKLEMLDF